MVADAMLTDAQHFSEMLVRLARDGAASDRIAVLAVLKWRSLDNALSPIIGHGGVAALFKRSVSLTRQTHAWLVSLHEGADQLHDFAALQSALSRQTSSEAATASGALLQHFLDLLTHLIGKSLSENLLRSIWDNTSSDGALQETSR